MTSPLQSLIKEREEMFHKEFWDKNENRHFFPIDDAESFNRTTIRKTLEAVYDELIISMPSSAENLSNLTPENAKATINNFMKLLTEVLDTM